jgi:hypothetical protein
MKNIITTVFFICAFMATKAQVNREIKVAPNQKIQKIILDNGSTTIENSPLKTAKPIIYTDLIITSLKVDVTPNTTNGNINYTLNVSCSVKNTGFDPVPLDSVVIQTYLSNEEWITRTNKDFGMTSYLLPTGGRILGWRRGEFLASGATVENSFNIYNLVIPNKPRPLFVLRMFTTGIVQDTNAENNMTFVWILL